MNENAYRLGCDSADLFCSFVEWICDDCRKRRIRQVFFLAREGFFFEKVLQRLELNGKNVEFKHSVVEISRKSTFLASIDENNVSDWDRYSNQYGDQSLAAFFATIGIATDQQLLLLGELPELQLYTAFNEQQSVKEMLASTTFRDLVRKKAMQQRRLLMGYLSNFGMKNDASDIAIVDIGWRGTIQDNLCYIYPRNRFIGYYFGLIPMLNSQPQNSKKYGFINQFVGRAMFLKSHTQLEMLCSCEKGSVIGFEEDGNKILPVTENNECDLYSWNNYTKDFQRGVFDAIEYARTGKFRVWRCILALTLCPDSEMAKAFFGFRYSELFGMGKHINMSEVSVDDKVFRLFPLRKSYFSDLKHELNKTMWPQGYLQIHHRYFLEILFNIALLFIALREQRRYFEIDKTNRKTHYDS